jgi:hypothetical protein
MPESESPDFRGFPAGADDLRQFRRRPGIAKPALSRARFNRQDAPVLKWMGVR